MWRLCCRGFNKKAYENEGGLFMPKAPPLWFPIRCTLEELYNGGEREINFNRGQLVGEQRCYFFGNVDPDILVVKISPGSRQGDQIVFPGMGAVLEGMIPGDVIFVVEEEPRAVFERRGYDLWAVKQIPLMEALETKGITEFEALDKPSIAIPKTQPGQVVEVLNEGMLVPHLGIKGSLFIRFEAILPKNLNLTDEDKNELKELLSKEDVKQSNDAVK